MPGAPPSLYRRHRPRTFADVVGQEHVVRTLSNAIVRGKVHHAYLFVGSRGTGKTSMAKILAASLNCQAADGPTLTPCGRCESCTSIAGATSLDVIEMDAASNNSVDDIRDLREKVAFAPVSGRHKVYILDEAHMLSTAAWNAFLKTLEEPPPNTIFVLATTEAAKVLPTVVDRCHRFDFARPTVGQIGTVLRRAADAEGIAIGDEALALVARSATGSFRDALGTLEQLLAYAGSEIATEDVLAVLGAADADLVFGAVDAVGAGDAREALLAAARLAESGRDVGRFFADLEAHARGLMVVQTLGAVPDELRVTAEQDARLAEQAERIGPADVVRLLDLIAAALRAVKDGADARTQLELTLVKAAVPAHDPSARALQSRLERLEARLGGAPAAAEPLAARAPSVAATAAGRASRPAPPPPTPEPPVEAAPVAAPTPEPATAPAPGRRHDVAAEAAGAAASAAAASHEPVAVAVVEAREGDAAPAVGIGVAGGEGADVAVGVELDLEGLAELWPAVLDSLRGESELVHAMLADARPTRLADGELTLTFTGALSKGKAENPATQALIGRAVRAVTGSTLRLACRLDPGGGPAGVPAATLSEDELIRRFVAEFDAEELPPEPDDDVPQSP